MGGRSLEVYAGVLDAEGKPTPVPRVWSLQMFCAWASAGFSAQRWGRDASNPLRHHNRRTLRCPPSGAVPLPPFVSLGSAVAPGQNAAVTFGGGGLGGGVVGVLGPSGFAEWFRQVRCFPVLRGVEVLCLPARRVCLQNGRLRGDRFRRGRGICGG